MNGNIPSVVDNSVVEELKGRTGDDGHIDLSKPILARPIGSEVEVSDGPFMGHKGVYAGQTKDEREIVLLSLLGRQVKVELDAKSVL